MPFVVGRYNEWMRVMAVISDGRVVTGAEDGRVLVWDPNRAQAEPLVLGQHDGAVRALAALPLGNGSRLWRGRRSDGGMGSIKAMRVYESPHVHRPPSLLHSIRPATCANLSWPTKDGNISGWLIHHP